MMSHSPTVRTIALALCGLLSATPPVVAQRPAGPTPPATYDAQIRYRIRADRTERIRQFDAMTLYLESVGFQRIPSDDPNEPADPAAERLRGTLPSNKVAAALREPHVRTMLLKPSGYRLPENPEQRVLVSIELYPNLAPARQKDLAQQTKERLASLGYVDKVGYDNRKNTRLFGTVPTAEIESLLSDLRDTPGGWLGPDVPRDELPDPIREFNPIRVVEVIAEPEGVPPNADAPAPTVDPTLENVAPDLWPEIAKEGGGRIRMEVVLNRPPVAIEDAAWRNFLQGAGDVAIEGRVGPVVTILAPASVARTIAASPGVATVRPVRPATRAPLVRARGIPADVFGCTGLGQLHGMGYRGASIRVAIIDASFAGAAKLLPGATLIDLTAARNPSLMPDPDPASDDVGRGTKVALAVKLAAPDAQLVLIRVDPSAAYMLADAAQYLHGRVVRPPSLAARNEELLRENERLRILRAQVTEDRRPKDEDFESDEAAIQRRREKAQRASDLAVAEQEYLGRLQRMAQLEEDLSNLRSVKVVVNALAWDIGYPTDGFGPLSRYIDETLFGRPLVKPYGSPLPTRGPPLWFQAAGDTRGQSWIGPLTDVDGNGVLEFATAGTELPKDSWTNELNFLAFRPVDGGTSLGELPAGARVRVALQWSEAHDPAADALVPDVFRTPLADLSLIVLRQRDATHTKLAADDFNVVARSVKPPQLIDRSPNVATYEQIVEFTLDTPGRFALRVEGHVPSGTRPESLPALGPKRIWEARGRLFVEVADDATRAKGRPVFGDFTTSTGGLGTPGDAVFPRTIGAADLQGKPQPYSAYGAYAGRELLVKPTFLTPDEMPLPGVKASAGTALANGFAGGLLATMLSAGAPESADLKWMCVPPYGLLKIPPTWIEQINLRQPHLNERKMSP